MNVLQINSVYSFGSTGRIVADIKTNLDIRGHYGYVAYGRGENSFENDEEFIKIGTKMDVYTHVIKNRIFDNQGFNSTRSTKNLISKLEKLDIDLIHLHNLHGYYINLEILFEFLKKSNIPVVWTLHDCWAFTGHCTHFDYINCNKWTEKCENCPEKNSYPSSYWLDQSEKNYLRKKELFNSIEDITIVTPSNWLHSKVKQSFLNDNKIVTIYNGIDIDKFSYKNKNKELINKYNLEGKFLILGVANIWTERKGLNSFIELSK
ncbi:glycosyltransferase, partial [Lysinibacillus telephonicus]|uniref:glycosyltransferase n=1 Tax=Lysinibacillus telephonicus TaxID=1714840 RepID=UPI00397BD42C